MYATNGMMDYTPAAKLFFIRNFRREFCVFVMEHFLVFMYNDFPFIVFFVNNPQRFRET